MKKIFILGALLFITSIPMVSCTDDDDKDPNFMPPDIVMGGGDVESEYPEDLPVPGASVVYAPSLNERTTFLVSSEKTPSMVIWYHGTS